MSNRCLTLYISNKKRPLLARGSRKVSLDATAMSFGFSGCWHKFWKKRPPKGGMNRGSEMENKGQFYIWRHNSPTGGKWGIPYVAKFQGNILKT